jgi:hypothetical protein
MTLATMTMGMLHGRAVAVIAESPRPAATA